MKKIVLAIIAILTLAACSSPYKDLLEEGNEFFDKGEYSQALKLYEYALDEDDDAKEAKEKIELIELYNELESINKEDQEEAFDLANEILKHEAINDKMKKEVKETLTAIEEKKEKEEELFDQLDKIEKDIKAEKFQEAAEALENFDFTIESNELYKRHEELGYALENGTIAYAEKEREKEEEAAEKKKEEEAKKAAASQSKYDTYIARAQSIEERMKDTAYEAGYMHDHVVVADQYYNDWDKLLNDVWTELKSDLDSGTFAGLKEDQLEWIKEKERHYKENPNREEAEVDRGHTTMNRTIYLIEEFLQ